MKTCHSADIVVIGAGIAGASVAAELAPNAQVLVLEMEDYPGYHTTGRSAAVFAPFYGPAAIRLLTHASASFFQQPPDDFSSNPLFSPRGILMFATEEQSTSLQAFWQTVREENFTHLLNENELQQAQPLLRPGYAVGGVLDTGGQDIDVAALHQGYLRQIRAHKGEVLSNTKVLSLQRTGTVWRIETNRTTYEAPVVVNAAGAWADSIGALAGAEPIGLVPKRRTALTVAAPAATTLSTLPISVDIDESFYLKPEVGKLLLSPANEDPESPCDVQPTEMDIALCIDRIERAFAINVQRIESQWAGLRSFVTDKTPVAGFSTAAEEFYWLAGQGGYGIQSAPALSRFAAAQITHEPIPQDLKALGLEAAQLSPARLSH